MFRFSSKNKQLGFTLLELLVVISIIAILMAIGAAAFTTAQQQGRDARRISDMQAIQKAFEQHYATTGNGQYAAGCSGMFSSFAGGNPPRDPVGSANYAGISSCTLSTYCICATLNSTTKGNSTSPNCTFTSSGSGGQYYCVRNVQ